MIGKAKFLGYLLAGAAFLAWSANGLELSPGQLIRSLPVIADYLGKSPPDWRAVGELWGPMLDTICIAVWGIVIAAIIGFPLGAAAARNLTSSAILRVSSLTILNILRSVSELIWAVFFVAAVGLGPFPGALALGVNFGGILGRLYAEAIENIDPKPLEALRDWCRARPNHSLRGTAPGIAADHLLQSVLVRGWHQIGDRSWHDWRWRHRF